jgi:hypothetical protein
VSSDAGGVIAKLRYCIPQVQPVKVATYLLKCPNRRYSRRFPRQRLA